MPEESATLESTEFDTQDPIQAERTERFYTLVDGLLAKEVEDLNTLLAGNLDRTKLAKDVADTILTEHRQVAELVPFLEGYDNGELENRTQMMVMRQLEHMEARALAAAEKAKTFEGLQEHKGLWKNAVEATKKYMKNHKMVMVLGSVLLLAAAATTFVLTGGFASLVAKFGLEAEVAEIAGAISGAWNQATEAASGLLDKGKEVAEAIGESGVTEKITEEAGKAAVEETPNFKGLLDEVGELTRDTM